MRLHKVLMIRRPARNTCSRIIFLIHGCMLHNPYYVRHDEFYLLYRTHRVVSCLVTWRMTHGPPKST